MLSRRDFGKLVSVGFGVALGLVALPKPRKNEWREWTFIVGKWNPNADVTHINGKKVTSG